MSKKLHEINANDEVLIAGDLSAENETLRSLIRTNCRPVIKDYAALKAYIDTWSAKTGMTDAEKIAAMKDEVVGLEIADSWTNSSGVVYDDPMLVTDVRMWKGADDLQHLGVMLMRKYATGETCVFDMANQEEATEATAAADTYYYGLAKGATKVTAANLTLRELSAGDTIPYDTYEKVFKNSLRDTSKNILIYGHNNWRDSAYRRWLNSAVAKGTTWWTQGHVGQVTPTNATTIRGYLQGISGFDKADGETGAHATEGLWKYVKKVYVTTWPNYATDGGTAGDTSTAYETLDWMWLPSGDEYYGGVNRSGTTSIEGELSPYWKEATGWSSPSVSNRSPTRIVYAEANKSEAKNVRLRSVNRASPCYDFIVNTTGIITNSYANGTAYASTPACVIY